MSACAVRKWASLPGNSELHDYNQVLLFYSMYVRMYTAFSSVLKEQKFLEQVGCMSARHDLSATMTDSYP